jgi:hypothetical protein
MTRGSSRIIQGMSRKSLETGNPGGGSSLLLFRICRKHALLGRMSGELSCNQALFDANHPSRRLEIHGPGLSPRGICGSQIVHAH